MHCEITARRRSWRSLLATLACLAAAVAGCGDAKDDKRPTGTVTGTVTLDGAPVEAGRVLLIHKDGPAATANIGSGGAYKAEATIGPTTVVVDHRGPPEQAPGGREGMMQPGKSLVPEQYASEKTSPLKFEVKAGTNEYDVKMTK